MQNPTPGKNPFELGSYLEKMPVWMQWLYEDLNSNFLNTKGRCGVKRFWVFVSFSTVYLMLLVWLSTRVTETVMVFLALLLLGWLYIAIPLYSISRRRLHDCLGRSYVALSLQLPVVYAVVIFALGLMPDWKIMVGVGTLLVVSLILLSMPSKTHIANDRKMSSAENAGESK